MQATRHAATMPNTFVAERAAQQQREPRKAEELDELALPGGTLLEGLRIVRPIGKGGFGIVYLAWDSQLERHVAIKEYMPSALVRRAQPSLDLEMRSEEDREVFEAGRRSFVNEARLLARFDHPSLVKVFRFWEAHRTAYMAMPYYQGPTLKTALCSLPGPATEEQLRGWLDPIMDALAVLHREKCFHRDVSPDNILLTSTGPLLLDFGAARRVISDRTQALTAVLKPGFAPIEQYGGTQLQGPWTDLYALAGVMHYAITGRPPVAAAARVVQDTRQALAETQAGRWRHGFLPAPRRPATGRGRVSRAAGCGAAGPRLAARIAGGRPARHRHRARTARSHGGAGRAHACGLLGFDRRRAAPGPGAAVAPAWPQGARGFDVDAGVLPALRLRGKLVVEDGRR